MDDLSERYNDGLVPAPQLSDDAPRLQRPAWQPTSAQVAQARARLGGSVMVLALLLCVCLFVFALALGWRP